ncbi:unnamed protein product, partial [Mesorhabditis belari]|uniref:BTB domain-containing protein n=1 Tax=Mesorhabditis belari TaxID=2138241 RepID=A0AAF3JBL0_9BILA
MNDNKIVVTKSHFDDFSVPTPWRKFEVICEGRSLFLNAGWLAELSPFFANYCFGSDKHPGRATYNASEDLHYNELLEFFRCNFYCPMRKPLNISNVTSVLRIAKVFNMRVTIARCEKFIALAAKNLDQTKLLQVTQAVNECDPNSTTLTLLVDRIANLSEKDLSTLHFQDIPGDVVADVFTHRMNSKKGKKKKLCTLM